MKLNLTSELNACARKKEALACRNLNLVKKQEEENEMENKKEGGGQHMMAEYEGEGGD